MDLQLRSFALPKAGNTREEYEDAFWPPQLPRDRSAVRLAVADGATETSFAKSWAQLLARGYTRGQLDEGRIGRALSCLEKTWRRSIHAVALPWYAQEKLELGAFAAVAGVEIAERDNAWTGFAIGDCCVFHTRGESILQSFPMNDAEQFNDRPLLLSSLSRNNAGVIEQAKRPTGNWEPGDTFLLMSDALAAWFLRRAAMADGSAIACLKGLSGDDEFAQLVELHRAGRAGPALKNDDVTLTVCTAG